MSLDLYSDEAQARLDTLKPVTAAPVGIFDNYLESAGSEIMKGSATLARTIHSGLAVVPMAIDEVAGTDLSSKYFKQHQFWQRASDRWVPNPQEVGIAGQITGQLLTGINQLLINPSLLVANTQMSVTEDLANKGVSTGKALAVGAVQGVGTGVGIWMPILGKTLTQRVVAGGVGFNVAQGVAMRGASGAILEGTPAAEVYSATDTTSLTLDVLMGIAFGGYAHVNPAMRAQGAEMQDRLTSWASKLKPSEIDAIVTLKQAEHLNSSSMPGKPVDIQDIDAHVQRIRQAIDDLANDRPVNVEAMQKPEYVPDAARQAEAENVSAYLKSEIQSINGELPNFLRYGDSKYIPQAGSASVIDMTGIMKKADTDPNITKTIDSIRMVDQAFKQAKAEKQANGITWNDSAKIVLPETVAQKLQRPDIQKELEFMKGETGWAEIGGKILRDPVTGEVNARTKWIPNYDWWPSRPDSLNEAKTVKAITKALAGQELNAKESRMVAYLADIADERVKSAEYKPTLEELTTHGLTAKEELEGSMVTRAMEINPKFVDDLADKHGAYNVEFMQKIKEFLNGTDQSTKADGAGKGGIEAQARTNEAKPAEAVDPLHTEAARFAQENPDLPIVTGKNADGSDITTTPRQMLEDADAVVKQAKQDATLFEVAAGCILGAL